MTATKLTVAAAYQHCARIAQRHYENFPTASRLIRSDLRPAVAAIYAFARAADDMADEGHAAPDKRIKQLEAWAELLERCVDQKLDHPVFLALGDAIRRHNLPVDALHDLLTAFRMDCTIHSYASEDELRFYCRHSANPVGRLVLALHGIDGSEALHASDAICTALQLANFWQDLSIDLPKGRCYLPDSWLHPAGLDHTQLLQGKADAAALQPVLAHAFAYTRTLFEEGAALLPLLPFRLRVQIAATLHGGMAVLAASERLADPLKQRPVLGRSQWLQLIPAVFASTLFPTRLKPEPA